ncbi:MAG: TetR/AcrR family transcriptional regulator [Rhizomicrobium sp.]
MNISDRIEPTDEHTDSSPAALSGKRELTKTQNRQTILNAARQVFADMGYGATTVRDIIRATPLASGTFYNYFKSKEEVYQALRAEVALTIRPRLREARQNATTIKAFLSDTIRIYFDYIATEKDNHRLIRAGVTAQLRLDTPEVIAGFEELRQDLEQAMASGLIPKIDADYLMAAIVGAVLEVSRRMILRDTIDSAEAADFVSNLILNGLQSMGKAS